MRKLILLVFALCFFVSTQIKAQVGITKLASTYKQTFDSMSASSTGSTMPTGWYFHESGSSNPGTYQADSGNASAGNTYSYGAKSGASDRAFGSISSSSNTVLIGVAFTNKTGGNITAINFSFTMEQWRLGSNTSGRAKDSSWAEISPYASSLTAFGPWLKVPQLNLYSVVTSGTVGPLDGNKSSNKVTVSYTITGFTIPDGTTVWLRWNNSNTGGNSDGLAIDDFTVTGYGSTKPSVLFANTALSIKEGTDSVKVTLNIINANANATKADIIIDKSSTATQGSDYKYTASTYTFPGASTNSISFYVKALDDTKVEGDETIVLKIRNVSNSGSAGIDSVLTITILDNDAYSVYKIRQAKLPLTLGIPDTLKYGYFKGIVISPNFYQAGSSFCIKDSTGAVFTYNPKKTFKYTVNPGDSVKVLGKVSSLNYQAYLAIDTIIKISSGNTIAKPKVAATLNDTNESDLVKLNNRRLISAWDTSGSYKNNGFTAVFKEFKVNGKQYNIFISKGSDLFSKASTKAILNITGIVLQSGKSASTGYFLWPRTSKDIDTVKLPLYKILPMRPIDVLGINDSALKEVSCYLKGVVQSPNFASGGLQFSIADNTGSMIIHAPLIKNYTAKPGDSVLVRGIIGQMDGLAVFYADSIKKINTGTVPVAKVVNKLNETTEAQLVKLHHVRLVDSKEWVATGTGFIVNVHNAKDSFQLYISSAVDLFNQKNAPKGDFDVTGISGQADTKLPFFQGYQLMVRSIADIQYNTLQTYTISQVKPYDTLTGIADSIGLRCKLVGTVQSGRNLSGNNTQLFPIADRTGAIMVSSESVVSSYTIARNDSLIVWGTVKQKNGLTQFEADSIKKTGSNAYSRLIKYSNDKKYEKLESEYLFMPLKLSKYSWDSSSAINGRILIKAASFNNSNDSITLLIPRNTSFYTKANLPLGFTLLAYGWVYQEDSTQPFLQNYYLIPERLIWEGIEPDKSTNLKVQLFPNPSSSTIHIAASFNIQKIEVTDIAGRILTEMNNVGNTSNFDMSRWDKGIYIVHISDGQNTITKKVIHQ